MTHLAPLKRFVDPERPITYGIVQAGPDIDGGVYYIRPVDMRGHEGVPDVKQLRTTSAEIARAYRRSSLTQGDIVVSIGPSYGKTMLVQDDRLEGANLTQGTARVAPRQEVHGPYLRWALRSAIAAAYWDGAISGATFRALNLGPLEHTPIPQWPADKQRAIADFLDVETARIDALIAKKRRLASLVEARFKRAVEVEVERLVEVHGTIPLKRFTGVTVGIVIQPSRWYVEEGGVAALRGVNVRPGKLDLNDLVQISEEGHRANAKSRLHENDLVVVRTGDAGAAVVVPPAFDGANCVDLLVIRRSTELDSQFLEFMLNSVWAKKQITRGSVGTIQSHFNVESLRELPVPCVPLEAQQNLRRRLDAESMRVGHIVSMLRRQLNLLTEHRQALITAAVTGEIEVPEPRRTPSNGRQMSVTGSRGRES